MTKILVKTPLYQQLNQLLRDLIREGEFEASQQFLTERQICERFGVSRATANKALSNLVAEGVLEFRKGVGTFVSGGAPGFDLRSLVSFTHKARAAGKNPSIQVLKYQLLQAQEADVDLTQILELQPQESMYYVERLRLVDRVPVMLEHRYIIARFCPDLTGEDLLGSLYDLWVDQYRLAITGAEQTIRAAPVKGIAANLLEVPDHTSGLLVTSIGYIASDVPLWWEQALYRGDAYEFHNRLGPGKTVRPASGALLDIERD
jgi:GntR family transcriptional regulator